MNLRVSRISNATLLPALVLFSAMLFCPVFIPIGWAVQGNESTTSVLANAIRDYPKLGKPVPIDLDQALAKPQALQIKLSPSGACVAYASREKSGYSIWVMDTESQTSRMLLRSRIIRSIEWSADNSTLIMQTASGIGFADIESGICGLFIRFDKNLNDEFAGIDRTHKCHVLLRRTITAHGHSPVHQLLRIGLDGEQDIVFEDEDQFYDFLLDSDGKVRFIRQALGHQHVIFRIVGDSKQEVLRTSALDMCSLLEFQETSDRLILAGYGDANFRSLHSLDLASDKLHEMHSDPVSVSDLESVATDPTNGEILVTSYYGDQTRNYGIAPDLKDDVAWLEKSFDNSIELAPRRNGAWLVRERAAGIGHDRFFLFQRGDGDKRKLVPILQTERRRRWQIADSNLSGMIPVHYTASDQIGISGYVSLPKGVPLETAPLIANIHGGPFARVKDRQSEIQYYVSQGYIVFSPNFRSSSGFGLRFMKSGYGQFSTRVQNDIVEGIEFILGHGIGDRNKIGAMGHSFGGYSVLSLLSTYPELFAAGVATAAPTDLIDTLFRIDHADINRYDGVPMIDVMPLLVADPHDELMLQRMHQQSPAANVERLDCPLLIWAGARDQRVPITHVKDYVLNAAELGKSVQLIIDHKTGHNYSSRDSNGAKSLTEITSSFFAEHLLGGTQTLSESSDEYLRRHSIRLKK